MSTTNTLTLQGITRHCTFHLNLCFSSRLPVTSDDLMHPCGRHAAICRWSRATMLYISLLPKCFPFSSSSASLKSFLTVSLGMPIGSPPPLQFRKFQFLYSYRSCPRRYPRNLLKLGGPNYLGHISFSRITF